MLKFCNACVLYFGFLSLAFGNPSETLPQNSTNKCEGNAKDLTSIKNDTVKNSTEPVNEIPSSSSNIDCTMSSSSNLILKDSNSSSNSNLILKDSNSSSNSNLILKDSNSSSNSNLILKDSNSSLSTALSNITLIDMKFPYVVSLQFKKHSRYQHACTGTIIHESFVLTAAHCFVKSKFPSSYIIKTSIDLSNNTTKYYKVVKIISHEFFRPMSGHDIALVKVKPKFIFDGVTLDKVHLSNQPIGADVEGYIIGWIQSKTKSHKLELVDFKTITLTKCKERRYVYVTYTDLCAISYNGRGACDGDSGGPLMSVDLQHQIGIISYGRGICKNGDIYVFTSISYMYNWIQKKLSTEK